VNGYWVDKGGWIVDFAINQALIGGMEEFKILR